MRHGKNEVKGVAKQSRDLLLQFWYPRYLGTVKLETSNFACTFITSDTYERK